MVIKVKVKEKRSTSERLMPWVVVVFVIIFGIGFWLLKDVNTMTQSDSHKSVRKAQAVAQSDNQVESSSEQSKEETDTETVAFEVPDYREWPAEDYSSSMQFVQNRLQFTTDEPESNDQSRAIFSIMPSGGDIRSVVKHSEIKSEVGVCCTPGSVVRSLSRRYVTYELEGEKGVKNRYVFDLKTRQKFPVLKSNQGAFAQFTANSQSLVLIGEMHIYWFDIDAKKLVKQPYHFKDILGFSMLKNDHYLVYRTSGFIEYDTRGKMIKKMKLGKHTLDKVIQQSQNQRYYVIAESSGLYFLFDQVLTKKYAMQLGNLQGLSDIAVANNGDVFASYKRVVYRLYHDKKPSGLFKVPSNIHIKHFSYID